MNLVIYILAGWGLVDIAVRAWRKSADPKPPANRFKVFKHIELAELGLGLTRRIQELSSFSLYLRTTEALYDEVQREAHARHVNGQAPEFDLTTSGGFDA